MSIIVKKEVSNSASIPDTDYKNIFVDSDDNFVKVKDSADTVSLLGAGVTVNQTGSTEVSNGSAINFTGDGVDVSGSGNTAHIIIAGGGVSAAGMIHVETIEIGTATSSITFSGLNGEADYGYFITGEFKNKVGNNDGTGVSKTIVLKPNGAGMDSVDRVRFEGSTGTVTSTQTSTALICGSSRYNNPVFVDNSYAPTGSFRYFWASYLLVESSPTMYIQGIIWNNDTTSISSLEIQTSDSSSNIDSGSIFSLYKYR